MCGNSKLQKNLADHTDSKKKEQTGEFVLSPLGIAMSPDQRLCPPVNPSGDSAPLDLGETQTLANRDLGESVF